jgi:predicted porin
MKKSIMALAALGAAAGTVTFAHAQTGVRIYGNIDTGYTRETGIDTRMACNYGNMLGFAGEENLGSGLKATFALEKWLELNDGDLARRRNEMDYNRGRGSSDEHIRRPDFQGQANVGLQHRDWGTIRLGRVYNLSIENYRRLDPFANFSVAASLAYGNNLYAETISNSLRYDSPSWDGLAFGLSYTTGEDDRHNTYYRKQGNDGFNLSLKYENGPLFLTSNYYRMADSNNSWAWNLGAAYTWGDATLSIGYQDSRTKNTDSYAPNTWYESTRDVKQKDAILGLAYRIGSGEIKASYSYAKWEEGPRDDDIHKYSIGYTYFFSKLTSLYGMVSYMDADSAYAAKHYNFTQIARDGIFGWQVGIRRQV